MNVDLEIRKLPLTEKNTLVLFLEKQESWKKLMSIIPQTLCLDSYKCDVSVNNPAKYRTEHFHIIQNASNLTKRFCSDILLSEWGTSGRVRPALGHLKYLLEKAQLFHVADFLTVQVLKQKPTARPTKGPGTPIVFNSVELNDSEAKKIEQMLNEIDYPSSAIENIHKQNSIKTNINYTAKEDIKTIPKIVISKSPDPEEQKPSFNVPLVIQNDGSNSESDMIKFSTGLENTDSKDVNVPKFSSLLASDSLNNESVSTVEDTSGNNIPLVIQNDTETFTSDMTQLSTSSEMTDSDSNNAIVPEFSSLLDKPSSDNNIPVVVADITSTDNFPTENNRPNISALLSMSQSSSNFPAISSLINNSSSETNKSRSCVSPLPNLSLNTLLPHFSYTELETATKNFDETPFSENGRFLGAGSFGKVYLAVDLMEKPIAVKKLLLENAEVVEVEDRISKQFKNEVEILSKYKHENLVTLLGYSCDGLTYCLLYEFVSGGSLKEKLQKHALIWTERLYVALGTAKAISYLHTAFSTPLIHRDVKSSNILLDVTNKPKLCDFGIIKHSLTQNTYTATTIMGTSAYMAPEAFRGDISTKLDTFSFGVVLLELLTAQLPMDENREDRDLISHVEENCKEGEIKPLLDTSAGSWTTNGTNFAQKLYEIAQDCLQVKKQLRPTISSVFTSLNELIQRAL